MNRRDMLKGLAALTPIGLLLANRRQRLANTHSVTVNLSDHHRRKLLELLKKKGRIEFPSEAIEHTWTMYHKRVGLTERLYAAKSPA